MRLWSVHPLHLDRQGLTACWREALLAQAVLAGRTRGYRAHPQLERFREVLETHRKSLLQQRTDIAAQLSEIQTFEKRVNQQLKKRR